MMRRVYEVDADLYDQVIDSFFNAKDKQRLRRMIRNQRYVNEYKN